MLKYRLKSVRVGRNLTQRELANLLGVSESKISKIETGKADCDTQFLCELSDCLGVSADQLLGRDNHISKSKDLFLLDFNSKHICISKEEEALLRRIREDDALYAELVKDHRRFFKRLLS